jgi:hypothetical protein
MIIINKSITYISKPLVFNVLYHGSSEQLSNNNYMTRTIDVAVTVRSIQIYCTRKCFRYIRVCNYAKNVCPTIKNKHSINMRGYIC